LQLIVNGQPVARMVDAQWVDLAATVDRLAGLPGTRIVCYSYDYAGALDLEGVPSEYRARMVGAGLDGLREMAGLLFDAAPHYLRWVVDIVSIMALHSARAGLKESGSNPHHLGLVRLSADRSPWALAEMAVHEASHQYCYLVARLGPLLENPDRLRYSPLKNANRPLFKILLGFHAFANVALLLQELRDVSAEPLPADNAVAVILDEVHQLWSAISCDAQLTSLGRALVEPLASVLGL
jgi:HEXXH motif-containing protein